jgi:hypothetical protein
MAAQYYKDTFPPTKGDRFLELTKEGWKHVKEHDRLNTLYSECDDKLASMGNGSCFEQTRLTWYIVGKVELVIRLQMNVTLTTLRIQINRISTKVRSQMPVAIAMRNRWRHQRRPQKLSKDL